MRSNARCKLLTSKLKYIILNSYCLVRAYKRLKFKARQYFFSLFIHLHNNMSSSYLDLVKQRIVIFDGAMGTNLQLQDLTAEDFGGKQFEGCNEHLLLSKPSAIETVHRSFLEVGVDVIETNTFGAFGIVLQEYGLQDKVTEINSTAATLAKTLAKEYSTATSPKFIAGSIGPGTKFPTLGHISFDELSNSYFEQALTLIQNGIDLFIIETVFDLLQAKAAMVACRKAMDVVGFKIPIQVQVTIELTGRMLPGTEIAAALCSLDAMKPDVIGMNCATGPAEMTESIRYLSSHSRKPISILPNAGLPSVKDSKMHYDLTPEELAKYHKEFIETYGIEIVGGCCGTTDQHLKMVVDMVRNSNPKKRKPAIETGAASLYSFVPYEQESSVLMIGERTNANGSKQFREAMLNQDYETIASMAKSQVAEGAHMIDVCVDYTGKDGTIDMENIMRGLATQSTVPIVLDSTEHQVIETALKWIGGKPILNSVNLEEGDKPGGRLDKFLTLAAKYGCGVVCTCIDTDGQARTAEWKLKAAKAIFEIATDRYGIRPEDLIFDALVLPLSTGMEESRKDGIETIEGIKLIKQQLPGVHTVLGLSNVSFGLKPVARKYLNTIFLDECKKAGLDAAIVHAAKIVPTHTIDEEIKSICLDLIYDRRRPADHELGFYDPLQALLEYFAEMEDTVDSGEDLNSLEVEERLKKRIIDGNKIGMEADLDEALDKGYSALEIINDFLLDGMKVVGDLFGSGQMQLPFVLNSAETMKFSVNYLENFMDKVETTSKGSIVLATVAGDVHDIGKNLVDIILSNNGYTVYNLGIKIPITEMLEAQQKYDADVIGMSGLLVKSTLIMKDNLEELNNRNLHDIPVILGGAALTRTYVESDLRKIYKGRVFYGKDAFEGLSTMAKLIQMKMSGEGDENFGKEVRKRTTGPRKSELLAMIDPATIPKRSPRVETDNKIFQPPFLGTKIAKGISVRDISAYLNETSLFRNQWGFRPLENENDKDFKDRVRIILREELDFAISNQILTPMVAWGYFSVRSKENTLIVYGDEGNTQEITRFEFPRQKEEPYLCIADFFRDVDSAENDYASFFVVTMGKKVSEETQKLFTANRYNDYVRLHGLGVEMAEALAEYWHFRIRQDWGYVDEDGPSLTGLFRQKYRGGRYSFGYPACPDLEDNAKVVEILNAEKIDVTVSEGFQLHPEQTTLAIVCHHPKAKYFVA